MAITQNVLNIAFGIKAFSQNTNYFNNPLITLKIVKITMKHFAPLPLPYSKIAPMATFCLILLWGLQIPFSSSILAQKTAKQLPKPNRPIMPAKNAKPFVPAIVRTNTAPEITRTLNTPLYSNFSGLTTRE